MVDDPAVLGARLRAMREAAGLTQVQLGKALGVTRSHIGLVENGRAGLALNRLQAWVEVCGGSITDVVADNANGLSGRINRLPAKRHKLVVQLVHILEWAEDRFVGLIADFFDSFEKLGNAEEGATPREAAVDDETPH